MEKEIQRWYQELERDIGKEKAREVETMVNRFLASMLEMQVDKLDKFRAVLKRDADDVRRIIEKLRSGD